MNNHYMGLKFWSNPSGGASGAAPDQAEVILIDEFGNYAAVNRVSVVIQSVAFSHNCHRPPQYNDRQETGSGRAGECKNTRVILTALLGCASVDMQRKT